MIAIGRLISPTSIAPLELAVYDRVDARVEHAPVARIVIVAIDDASIAKLGEWPWPRDVHASLIERLRSRRRARRCLHRALRSAAATQ